MAATKRAQSPIRSEHAAEETLPLYEEFQYSETQADIIPPPTATPVEVRDYLASLLKNKHSLPEDHARRVVSRWTLGTGRELRNYTPQMYLDILGHEEGWFLYRDVRMDLYRSRTVTSVQKFGACESSLCRLRPLSITMNSLTIQQTSLPLLPSRSHSSPSC